MITLRAQAFNVCSNEITEELAAASVSETMPSCGLLSLVWGVKEEERERERES